MSEPVINQNDVASKLPILNRRAAILTGETDNVFDHSGDVETKEINQSMEKCSLEAKKDNEKQKSPVVVIVVGMAG